MNTESANKFISALVKALQTLCHGYVEFHEGIEIIGHIYLSIDSGTTFDYIVKEKLCKDSENSTVFVSRSFKVLAPYDDWPPAGNKNGQTTEPGNALTYKVLEDSQFPLAETRLNQSLTGASPVGKSGPSDRRVWESRKRNSFQSNDQSISPCNNFLSPVICSEPQFGLVSPPAGQGLLLGPASGRSSFGEGEPKHVNFVEIVTEDDSSQEDSEDELDLVHDVTFIKEENGYDPQHSHKGLQLDSSFIDSEDKFPSIPHDPDDGGEVLDFSFHQNKKSVHDVESQKIKQERNCFETDQDSQPPLSLSSPCDPQDQAIGSPSSSPTEDNHVGPPDTFLVADRMTGSKLATKFQQSESIDFASDSDDADLRKSKALSNLSDTINSVASGVSKAAGYGIRFHDRKDKSRQIQKMRKSISVLPKQSQKEYNYSDNMSDVSDQSPSPPSRKRSLSQQWESHSEPSKRSRVAKQPGSMEDQQISDSHLEDANMNPSNSASLEQDSSSSTDLPTSSGAFSSSRSVFRNDLFSKRMRGSYKQYTPADKLEIVKYGIKYGSTAASRKYNMPESTVRSWTKKMDTFIMQMKLSGEYCDS